MAATKNISIEAFQPGASVIQVAGRNFTDNHGRVLDLRGANVSSSSKVPQKLPSRIDRHTESSYVGRPFPLEEADEHWARLKSWGLTFLRINVTWEAIEHAGPGQYDQEYLKYLRTLLESMGKAGLVAYVSIHQDVWSRYSGGSGAPGWTLEAAGFDLSDDGEKLSLSGAAFLDGIKGGRLAGERGLWPTGYQKLACATMNTLFWGGSTYAPSFVVDGQNGGKVNIQEFLQEAFLAAVEKLNEAVGDLDGVLGIELMNEPHAGFIGLPTLQEWDYNTDLHLAQCPSPLQSFSLGSGHPTQIPFYVRAFPFPTRQSGTVLANSTSVSAWKDHGKCIWEKEGVWRWSKQKKEGIALQDDYFSKNNHGEEVNFYRDCYFPFVQKWNKRIGGRKMKMVGPIPNEFAPTWPQKSRPDNFVFAPHWYDLNTLFKKSLGFMTVDVQGMARGMYIWNALYFGREQAKQNYALQIKNIVESSREKLGEVPVIIGETGVPMDINDEAAFKNGDFSWQERMMDHIISAMESSMIGFNLWSYNPLNRDDTGDDWNAENFSWYSSHNRDLAIKANGGEKSVHLNVGARLLDAIVRPYAIATAGTPLSIKFDYETSAYTYRFSSPVRDPNSDTPTSEVTELFLPAQHYTEGKFLYTISAGGQIRFDFAAQRAYVWFIDDEPARLRESKVKVRRVDFYVPNRTKTTGKMSSIQIAFFILFAIFWLGVAWWTQMNEIWWDKRLGFTHSIWGTWGTPPPPPVRM